VNNDPIVIVGLARTPMGAFQGELKGFAAAQLGAAAIRAAVEHANLKPEEVDELIMGYVLPAGHGRRRRAKLHSPQGYRPPPVAPRSTRSAARA
jgi:acetyl-CoA acetyltransferase